MASICFLFPFRCRSIFSLFDEIVWNTTFSSPDNHVIPTEKLYYSLKKKKYACPYAFPWYHKDTTGFINEESENISHLLDYSSDGEFKLNNLMLFGVTKMFYSIFPHYSARVHLQQISCQKIRTWENGKWESNYWMSSWRVATSQS